MSNRPDRFPRQVASLWDGVANQDRADADAMRIFYATPRLCRCCGAARKAYGDVCTDCRPAEEFIRAWCEHCAHPYPPYPRPWSPGV